MITILSTSSKDIRVPYGEGVGYSFRLYVAVTTSSGNLTYQWYLGDTILVNETRNVYSVANFDPAVHDTSTAGSFFKCEVKNGNDADTIIIDGFKVTQETLLNAGITGPVMPADEYEPFYSTIDTLVKGGVHVYEDIERLKDSVYNYTRIKYGQLAIVTTTSTSSVNFYQCNVQDPLVVYQDRVTLRTSVANQAANWVSIIPGEGAGAELLANLNSQTLRITSVSIINGGSGYIPGAVFLGLSSNDLTHSGTSFGSLLPSLDTATGEITSVRVLNGGTNYTAPPIIRIFTGTFSKFSDLRVQENPPWSVGSEKTNDWVERPLLAADVDGDTIQIIDNQLVAIGTGGPTNVLVDDKTIQYVELNGVEVLSATLYDQDLNTFNSVNFHDVTTNVVIENTMAIQTHTYATSSTVGRNSLSAINNRDAAQGPYNVLEVTADSKKYIPLDLTRANTFLLTLSDVSNPIGTYDGFVLINKTPLTSSFDVPLQANTTYETFIQPDSIKGKIYTITLFVKHLNVMSTLPLKLYTGTVQTDANRIADNFSVTQIPVKWSAGSYPALYTTPANPNHFLGSEDVIMYTTYDAGATWYGFIGGTDLR